MLMNINEYPIHGLLIVFGGVWIESCKNPIITRKVLKLMFTIVVKAINK